MRFSRLVAAGNRYAAVDGRAMQSDWSRVAQSLCRQAGGADTDGLVVVSQSETAAFRLFVFNSDGSEAEISGNGLRLAVKFALDRDLVELTDGAVIAETAAGLRTVWPQVERGKMVSGRIRMGSPNFTSSDFPSVEAKEVVALEVAGRTLAVTCVSVGNPHAVAVLDEPVEEFPLLEIGPIIQNHSLFPNRINFEIVNVIDDSTIRARIFERGEGETKSSGTGSTASAVICRLRGFVGPSVDVECVGGRLHIEWPGEGDAFLEGPTEDEGSGVWDPDSGSVTWNSGD